MKTFLTVIFAALISLSMTPSKTIHDFSIQALDSDETINLSDFKGKKILVVNVASKCGFTPQYEYLQKLYDMHKDKLVVIGFPCDQFGGQEYSEETLIREFCTNNYAVTFPMTTKIDVKGDDQHPIYEWLTSKALNGKDDYKVGWNFNKFLIDEEGKLIEYFPSKVKPLDQEILSKL